LFYVFGIYYPPQIRRRYVHTNFAARSWHFRRVIGSFSRIWFIAREPHSNQ
jgi:hypothetical protein